MLRVFPLLAIPVAIYNLVALGAVSASHKTFDVVSSAFTITMFSGDPWKITAGDIILFVSLLILFIEVIKSTRTTSREMFNNALSMLVFVVALIEFITLKGFATSVFFFIMLMTMFDTIAGFTITAMTAKRDLSVAGASDTA